MLSAVTPSFVTKALRADTVLFNAEIILPPPITEFYAVPFFKKIKLL
jgi:hypothetical protein